MSIRNGTSGSSSRIKLAGLPPIRSQPRGRLMTDVISGLGSDARDKAALAEMRALTASWTEPPNRPGDRHRRDARTGERHRPE